LEQQNRIPIVDADFDAGTDGFQFFRDTFQGPQQPGQPAFSSGEFRPTDGFSGGALGITLGGLDNSDVLNMSGGWRQSFTLSEATDVEVTFRYRLTQTSEYESDEFSEVLVNVRGGSLGSTGQDFAVARLTGDGNGGAAQTTDWQIFNLDLPQLAAGNYEFTVGGFNNKKTFSNESTEVLIDDVAIAAVSGGVDILLEAHFDSGTDGFTFVRDAFRAPQQPTSPDYAAGSFDADDGFQGGALRVDMGGIDNADVLDMSGGWRQSFTLDAPGAVTLSFRYNLTQAANYEADEFSEVIVTLDGQQVGSGGNDFVARITGDGNGGVAQTTGWQTFSVNLGPLSAGTHNITIGGFNNKKTFGNESSELLIDDVVVAKTIEDPTVPDTIFESRFGSGTQGFSYRDDAFQGSLPAQPAYADGSFSANTGPFPGGALTITLGGIDNADILDMSGGWTRDFTLNGDANLLLGFRYSLTQSPTYEADEFSEVIVNLSGGDLGSGGTDIVVTRITGDGNPGPSQTSGWQVFKADLGALSAGDYSLTIGGLNNKKTFGDEVTEIAIDDVALVSSDDLSAFELPGGDATPLDGIQAALAGLDYDQFKADIQTLADFGDRTQGSASNVAAGNWIEDQLEAMGYAVERHAFTFQGELRENIYATKVGSERPDQMYMVSAHFDGRGGGGAADDDGSGVSLVLQAARAFAQPGLETETSVRFIFWNAEEVGLVGSEAYVDDRASLQGTESPPGSGLFPEPEWLGIIQHDMILFDHGLPVQPQQIPGADIDIEYRSGSAFASQSLALANALQSGAGEDFLEYPAEIGPNMSNTDSVPFQNFTAAISVRENQRLAEIGQGSNPNWHQPSDVFETYSEDDFLLGFNAVQMTVGGVAELAGARPAPGFQAARHSTSRSTSSDDVVTAEELLDNDEALPAALGGNTDQSVGAAEAVVLSAPPVSSAESLAQNELQVDVS